MKKGEIATIIAIGSMVFLLITSAVSTFLTKKPQITSTKAETVNCTYSIANRCFGECGETTPCPKCKNGKYRCPETADDSPTTPSNTPIPPNTPIPSNCPPSSCSSGTIYSGSVNSTCANDICSGHGSYVPNSQCTSGAYRYCCCSGANECGAADQKCCANNTCNDSINYECKADKCVKRSGGGGVTCDESTKSETCTTGAYTLCGDCQAICGQDGCQACQIGGVVKYRCKRTGLLDCTKPMMYSSEQNCKNSGCQKCTQCNLSDSVRYECDGSGPTQCGVGETTCGNGCCTSSQECKNDICIDKIPSPLSCKHNLVCSVFGDKCNIHEYYSERYSNEIVYYKSPDCSSGETKNVGDIKNWCCSGAPSSDNLGKCIQKNLKYCSDFSCKQNTQPNSNDYYQQGSENQFYQLVGGNCSLISKITTYCCNSGPPPAGGSVEVTTGEANPVTINSAVLNGFYAKSGDNITITETGFIFLGENYNTNTVNTPFNRQVSFGESSMHPTYQYQAYVKYLDSGVERTATDKNGSKSFVPVAVQSSTQYKCKDPTSYNNGTYDLLDYPQTFVRDCPPEIKGKRYFYVSGKDSNDICIMKCKKINELYNTSYTGDCNSDTGSEDTCISKFDKPNANKFNVTVAFGISKNCGNSGGKITGVGLSLDKGAVLDSKSFDPPITDYKTTNFTLKLEKGKLYRLRAWMNVQKGTGIYAYYSDVKVVDPNSDSSGISIGVQHDDDDCSN